jgi:predicted nucleic acid-binding protein
LKVVDSTFLIGLLWGDAGAYRKADELDGFGGAATTTISVFEVSYGVSRAFNDPARRMEELRRVLANLEVLPLSVEASLMASEICNVYAKGEVWIDPFDALVAGIAVTCGAEALVTRRAADFELVPGLEIDEF